MGKLRFVDLTPEERAIVCNGCGGKGLWLKPPDWLFKASCDHHDFNYWLGCTEEDRRRADWQFYLAMIEDTLSAPWWRRPFARARAWVYYTAVRLFAKSFFYYGPRERTREDLEKALAEAA